MLIFESLILDMIKKNAVKQHFGSKFVFTLVVDSLEWSKLLFLILENGITRLVYRSGLEQMHI